MREVKFRGKALLEEYQWNSYGIKNNNRWIEGNLIQNENNPWIVGDIVEADWEYLVHEFWVEVESKTVGQYTGLKDKNGREIYEGDIVYYKSEVEQFGEPLIHVQIGVISIDKGMVGFRGKTRQVYRGEANTHNSNFLMLSSEIYEVIGNICENPELLEFDSII